MEATTQAAWLGAASALGGALLGAVGAWFAASSTNRIQRQIAVSNLAFQKMLAEQTADSQRRAELESMILRISDFAIQYPTLEKDSYCEKYPDCPGDPNGKERYECYCAYVFNVLAAVHAFFAGDEEKIQSFVGAEELIRRHYRCWQADTDNLAHDDAFVHYVQDKINDLRRQGKIR